MKVKELIKELEMFDKELDVQCADSKWLYAIVKLNVGNYVHTVELQPFCRIILNDGM